PGKPVHLAHLIVVEGREVADVPVRRDEHMSRRVRELVQDDERAGAAVNEQLLLGVAEDAPVELVRVLDVFEAPRRPQRLRAHSQRLKRKNASSPISVTSMPKNTTQNAH